MFQVSDYVVCPGHGVGQIINIEQKTVGDEILTFYIIKVVSNGMTVMVPTNSDEGVRELVDETDIESVFSLLADHDVKVDTSTWNRRHRDYVNKVKTGSLLEIADVLRSLLLLKGTKKLSFGERRMLDQCKDLIIKEVSLSTGTAEQDISVKIDSCF
ncbi:CarD family transcriptional regulator [Bacteriovoracaceae bacterium]|nr:CarD family transcriptional regulator [Bacteriovoracaceae bacterium]